MSSDDKSLRNMERERFLRDTDPRPDSIEVDPGVWVRGDRIDMVRGAGCDGSRRGRAPAASSHSSGDESVYTSHLTPEQLMRAIVALSAGRQA